MKEKKIIKKLLMQLVGLMLVQVISATSVKQSLRILALFPHSGKSHWQVYEPIFEELAKRGNNVTVVGHFPREIPIDNYHDISIAGDANMSVNVMDMNVMGSNSYFASMLGDYQWSFFSSYSTRNVAFRIFAVDTRIIKKSCTQTRVFYRVEYNM